MKKKVKDNLLENTDWEQFDEENDKLDGISDNDKKIIFTKIYDNIARGRFIVKRIDYYNYILYTFDFNPTFYCYIYLDIEYRHDATNRVTKYIAKETPKKIIIKTDNGKYVFEPTEFNMLIKQYCKHADDFLAQLHDSILYSMTHREISRDYDVFKRNLNRPQTFSSTNGVDIGDSKMKDADYYYSAEPEDFDVEGVFEKSVAKHAPTYFDTCEITYGWAEINISQILNKLDASTKSIIINEIIDGLNNEFETAVVYEDDVFAVSLEGANIAEEEIGYTADTTFVEDLEGPDMYDVLEDEKHIIDKKLYNTFVVPANAKYDITSGDEYIYYGAYNLNIQFIEDGFDFIKSKFADKAWHIIYHVLEDNDLTGMLVPDENDIEETEVIESNVFAGKAGLFTGKLTIDNIRVYWEYDCNDLVAEPDEYDEYYDR